MTNFWSIALSIMKEKKIKQTDLIQVTGQSRSGVSAWVTRDLIPRADHALAIADKLGVSVRYLVTGKDDAELPYRVKELLRLAQGLNESELIYFCDQIKNYRVLEDRKKGEASPGSSDSVARS